MNCAICGRAQEKEEQATHLPRFYRCDSCSGYIHREGPPPNYEASYFVEEQEPGIVGRLLGRILSFFLWTRARRILRIVSKEIADVLDYGCGNGKLVSYLKAQTPLAITGVDPSPSAVELAQKNGLPVFHSIPKDARYDLIMFWHSLEHTDTPRDDLQKLMPHLKTDGKLLIAVPLGDSLEAIIAKDRWFCYDWPFHRVHFTPKAIETMLVSLGLKMISIDHLNIEYTASSLIQTWLNLLLPKNALYTIAAHRRTNSGRFKLAAVGLASLVLTILFSPILLIFFLIQLATKRTAAVVVVAGRTT